MAIIAGYLHVVWLGWGVMFVKDRHITLCKRPVNNNK